MDDPAPVEADPVELTSPAPDPLALPESAPPEERLHLARERARHGDWEGTRVVLGPIVGDPAPHGFTARYLSALSLEFEGRLAEALAAYDALMTEDATDDVRFRRAETLGKLDRFDDARDALRSVHPGKDAALADLVKVEALAGVWDLRGGKERRGERHLRAITEGNTEPAYYLATARLALLELAAGRAAELTFVGSDNKRAKNLQRRAALVLETETQLADLIRLGDTELALRGFVDVAGVYRSLGDDLHAEPVPDGLTSAQAEIYREELGKKVVSVWTKSVLYCEKGLEYAARQDWIAAPVADLEAAKVVAVARVDGDGVDAAPAQP